MIFHDWVDFALNAQKSLRWNVQIFLTSKEFFIPEWHLKGILLPKKHEKMFCHIRLSCTTLRQCNFPSRREFFFFRNSTILSRNIQSNIYYIRYNRNVHVNYPAKNKMISVVIFCKLSIVIKNISYRRVWTSIIILMHSSDNYTWHYIKLINRLLYMNENVILRNIK